MPRPSVGRIVHYVGAGRVCLAAMITHVWTPDQMRHQVDAVSVTIFDPNGETWPDTEVEPDFAHHPGTWHWPERVDE